MLNARSISVSEIVCNEFNDPAFWRYLSDNVDMPFECITLETDAGTTLYMSMETARILLNTYNELACNSRSFTEDAGCSNTLIMYSQYDNYMALTISSVPPYDTTVYITAELTTAHTIGGTEFSSYMEDFPVIFLEATM